MKKIVSESVRTLCLLAVLSIIGFALLGIILFPEGKSFGILYVLEYLLIVILFAFLVYKFSDSRYQWIWMFLVGTGILIRIIYATTIDAVIRSDELVCFQAAQQTVKGVFSWNEIDYFQRWAYQIPFVLYEALVLKIFGTVRALYIFNGLFSIGICCLIYLIVNKIYGRNTALITTAIYSCFPVTVFEIADLYNHGISGVFFLTAVYFFINMCKEERLSFWRMVCLSALTGMFLGISNLFRTEAIIGLLGVECWFIYYIIAGFKNENKWQIVFTALFCMLIVYAIYKTIYFVVDFAVIHANISPRGIKNGCIYWFILCGFTPDNFGRYNERYVDVVYIQNKQEQFEYFKNSMHEIFAMQSPAELVKFFFFKLYYMWGNPHYCSIFNKDFDPPKFLTYMLTVANHSIYTVIFMLAAIGIKKKHINNCVMFILIVVLGFFLVYIIKETGCQYRHFTVFMTVILSACGIDFLSSKNALKN